MENQIDVILLIEVKIKVKLVFPVLKFGFLL